MKARDVLAEAHFHWAQAKEQFVPPAEALTAALLAATPEGEGVYIAPDGTLMRTVLPERAAERRYRLVPIEDAP